MPPKDEQQETSMRDDFESAISDIENDEDGAVTTETQATADEQPTLEVTDGGEEAAETEAEEQSETESSETIEKADSTTPDGAPDVPDDKSAQSDGTKVAGRPPASWPPAAREEWKSLPDNVKAQIHKREGEINKFQNEGAENRKTGAAFKNIADQYAQTFAAEGAPDALTGAEELFKTVALLQAGSPAQKAGKIAGFIQHYGIDVTLLDKLITAQIAGDPAGGPADDPMTLMINERLKPVDNLLARLDRQDRDNLHNTNMNAIKEVSEFKDTAEFYTDVQDDMADMVEMAASRGRTMPLQEAYDKACALNPEISDVLAKRTSNEALANGGAQLTAKLDAASSIHGKQGGGAVSDADVSMRSTIEELYDAQQG